MPRLVTRTSIVIFITARFHIKNTNKVIIFGQTADQMSGVISISSVFCCRVSLGIDGLIWVTSLVSKLDSQIFQSLVLILVHKVSPWFFNKKWLKDQSFWACNRAGLKWSENIFINISSGKPILSFRHALSHCIRGADTLSFQQSGKKY